MISILVLLLLGVAFSRHVSCHGDGIADTPIAVSPKSICAELCRVGLGGKPCGDGCKPANLTDRAQSDSSDERRKHSYEPRTDACPVLCANHLGHPLCNCTYPRVEAFSTVDFIGICSFYCRTYDYHIAGCHDCQLANMTRIYDSFIPVFGMTRKVKYDWDKWCSEMCEEGDGGSACNCDILPMMLTLK